MARVARYQHILLTVRKVGEDHFKSHDTNTENLKCAEVTIQATYAKRKVDLDWSEGGVRIFAVDGLISKIR